MKTLQKSIMIILCAVLCIGTCSINTQANEEIPTDEELVQRFKEKTQETDSYKSYENEIKSIQAETINVNRQIVISYILNQTDTSIENLVFIGNEELDFEAILYIDSSLENTTLKDLLNNVRTRAHLGYCTEKKCTRSEAIPYRNPQPGCSAYLGAPCSQAMAIPVGDPIIYIICKLGVAVSCNMQVNIKCTRYETIDYECEIF